MEVSSSQSSVLLDLDLKMKVKNDLDKNDLAEERNEGSSPDCDCGVGIGKVKGSASSSSSTISVNEEEVKELSLDKQNDTIIYEAEGKGDDVQAQDVEMGEDTAAMCDSSGTPNRLFMWSPNLLASKSILRGMSKYETVTNLSSLNFSFGASFQMEGDNEDTDEDINPRKRVRFSITPSRELEDEVDMFAAENIDCDLVSGHVFKTCHSDEEMVWVSPPPAPLDFTMINEDSIRTERLPVPKKFSVEVDMHFIDEKSISRILELKPLMMTTGFFNYEQACHRRNQLFREKIGCPYIYPENALNLQSLDEGLDGDLVFSQDVITENSVPWYFAEIWTTSKGFREYILRKSRDLIKSGIMPKGFSLQDSGGEKRSKDYHPNCGILFNSVKTATYLNDEEFGAQSLPIEFVDHFPKDKAKAVDICDIQVSDDFVRNVLAKTENNGSSGLHFIIADNPEWFNVHEACREVRFQRKLYSQCIIALLTLREGGTFVVKIFDILTPFSAGLIFLMHRCFKTTSIHKPRTSSPFSSERFLICRGKLSCETSEEILQVLLACHYMVMTKEPVRKIVKNRTRRRCTLNTYEVKKLVPLRVIGSHAGFFEFLRLQNIKLADTLFSNAQEICLSVPENQSFDGIRCKQELQCQTSRENNVKSNDCFDEVMKSIGLRSDWLSQTKQEYLSKGKLQEISCSRESWVVFPNPSKGLAFHPVSVFLGCGGENVFYHDGTLFRPIKVQGLTLTKGTVVLGTIVEVPVKNGRIKLEFLIFDAITLTGVYIGDKSFEQRRQCCTCYADALNQTREFDYLKCSVINVCDPLVLNETEPVISVFLALNEKNEKENGRIILPNKSSNLISAFPFPVDGFLFYKKSGTFLDGVKDQVLFQLPQSSSPANCNNTPSWSDMIELKI